MLQEVYSNYKARRGRNQAFKAKRLGEGGTQAFGIYFISQEKDSCKQQNIFL
jgi:hypothetical protein